MSPRATITNVRGQNDIVHGVLIAATASGAFGPSHNFFASQPASRCRAAYSSDLRRSAGRIRPDSQRLSAQRLNIGFIFFGQRFSRKSAAELVNAFIADSGPPTVTSAATSFMPRTSLIFQLHSTTSSSRISRQNDAPPATLCNHADFFFIAFAFTR